MTRILVAEDEAPQRAELCRLLQAVWPEAVIVAASADGLAAIRDFDTHQPEVAFLDVKMPGASGLEVADHIAGRARLVFVTAYDTHAIRAFEQGAVDYLLKPVVPERLRATIARLQARGAAVSPALDTLRAELRAVLGAPAAREHLHYITASVGDTVRLYPIDEVIAFRASDKYTLVWTERDEAVIRTSVRELLAQLEPDSFWQIHRGTLVRPRAVAHVRRDEGGKLWVTLRGRGEALAVSPSYQHRFRSM